MRNFRSLSIFVLCICICSLLFAGCDRRPQEYGGIPDGGSNEEIDPHSY